MSEKSIWVEFSVQILFHQGQNYANPTVNLTEIWLLTATAPCKTDYRDQSTRSGYLTQAHVLARTALVDLAHEWKEVVSTENKENHEEG